MAPACLVLRLAGHDLQLCDTPPQAPQVYVRRARLDACLGTAEALARPGLCSGVGAGVLLRIAAAAAAGFATAQLANWSTTSIPDTSASPVLAPLAAPLHETDTCLSFIKATVNKRAAFASTSPHQVQWLSEFRARQLSSIFKS